MKTMIKILKTIPYLFLVVLVSYYNFETDGVLGLITNLAFFVLGALIAAIWTKNSSENNLESLSSKETNTFADVAEQRDMIGKE